MASHNLDEFRKVTKPALPEIKNLKYDLAWVEGQWAPLQLAEAVLQRGVDDFQRFWLWLYGIEKAPEWFDEIIQKTAFNPKFLDATALPLLQKHLELYSKAIFDGYQVIRLFRVKAWHRKYSS
jgi:hypothetical protein